MAATSFLFGGDLALQASEPRCLFESPLLPLRFWLECPPCEIGIQRTAEADWEEILLVHGELRYERSTHRNAYLCLPPGLRVPQLSAANQGTILLRVAAGNHRSKPDGQNNFAAGKPPVEDLDFARLAWNEVPARRANDPGARVAELSANPSRTRVSSLMECRPGWLLSSHEHLSDVFAFCARGGGILGVAQQALTYEAGHLAVIPAGVQHCFETGKEGAFLAVFVFEPSLERSLGEEAAATINHNTQSRIEEGSHEYDPCPDCR